MKGISIVVPVFNEEQNIRELVRKIDTALKTGGYTYEVIFVDDHSSDGTRKVIKNLSKTYPLRLFQKVGKKGKAYSLLEGFSKARYNILCMIDADLQYSPKYIPQMIKQIEKGADIVVSNRKQYVAGQIRKMSSKIFHLFFVKVLHSLPFDTQSGLKILRKSVLNHITLSPSPWTFDLELLLKAHHAGYKIESLDIIFNERHTGSSKINLLKSSMEIGLSALRLKLQDSNYIPFTKSVEKKKGKGFHHNGKEFVNYTDLAVKNSAYLRISIYQKLFISFLIVVTTLYFLINWHLALVTVISVLSAIYFLDLVFNFFLVYRSFFREPEININPKSLASLNENTLPMYTILCPLYKEWEVLPQFVQAIKNLNYPKNKLQVLLLLEKDDKETIKQVNSTYLPSYFDTVIIPKSQPKTKPKALNYGLRVAKGEFVVIYDAEDIPDPMQLKKAVVAFNKAKKDVICIQAKLSFYNPTQNILTRLFTIEYSLWFDLVLTGLQSIHAPIPLGGTSNHFRKNDLALVKSWDAFNVTEDADLGMRIVQKGFTTAIINSYTMEEANSDAINWFKQRSRWMRDLRKFFISWKTPHFWAFQLIIGAKVLSVLINPIMWLMTISYFAFHAYTGTFIQSLYITPVFYIAIFSLMVGNFLYMYYYMLGAAKRNQWELIAFALLTPIYWLGMSAAAIFALWEFIFRPYYWHKTRHGLHLESEKKQSQPSITSKLRWPQIALSPALD